MKEFIKTKSGDVFRLTELASNLYGRLADLSVNERAFVAALMVNMAEFEIAQAELEDDEDGEEWKAGVK